MRPIIEFCASNMFHGTDRVMAKLEENPEYDVIEYGCLGNCGLCFERPYALVNGEIVDADSADELYGEIVRTIDRLENEMDELDRLLGDD